MPNRLNLGDRLTPNNLLSSQNGWYTLIMHSNGRLALYGQERVLAAVPGHNDAVEGSYAIVEPGGFRIRAPGGDPVVWSFPTSGGDLTVEDDGRVTIGSDVIYP
jgi:hypothetical protein